MLQIFSKKINGFGNYKCLMLNASLGKYLTLRGPQKLLCTYIIYTHI